MAFDLAGKIVLSLDQGSLGKVISEAKQGLSSELGVKVKGPSDLTNRAITALSKKLDVLGNNFIKANAAANTFGSTLTTLAPKVSNVANSLNVSAVSAVKAKQAILNTAVATKKLGKESEYVTSRVQEFGRQTGITARRFAAFLVSASVFYNFSRALTSGFTEAVAFQKQMIRLEQTTGKTQIQLLGVNQVIDKLAINFGVSSKGLSEIAVTLGQAGLTAKETSDALEVLGKTTLAPTFKDINKTTEGLIAAFRQFKLESREFKEVFSSINTVAARFAVESEDIVVAIQKSGGVFATLDGEIGEFTKTGGQRLKEFISIFSAVRDTTRESADSIATGLRTIFSRLQRPRTQDFIKDTLGIDLTEIKDGEKVFVGGLEAIKRLNAGLASIKPNSTLFANVVEEIGGIRQSSRVIPLLTQIGKIQQALNASKEDSTSLDKDAITAQKALSVQLDKTKENFFKLFREITSSTSFNILLDGVLKTTNALITMARAFKDILPLVVAFAGVKLFKNFPTFGQGVGVGLSELVSPKFGKIPTKKAKGGFIPGYGGGDQIPALLEKGEYVLPKEVVKRVGVKGLDDVRVRKFAKGSGSSEDDEIISEDIRRGRHYNKLTRRLRRPAQIAFLQGQDYIEPPNVGPQDPRAALSSNELRRTREYYLPFLGASNPGGGDKLTKYNLKERDFLRDIEKVPQKKPYRPSLNARPENIHGNQNDIFRNSLGTLDKTKSYRDLFFGQARDAYFNSKGGTIPPTDAPTGLPPKDRYPSHRFLPPPPYFNPEVQQTVSSGQFTPLPLSPLVPQKKRTYRGANGRFIKSLSDYKFKVLNDKFEVQSNQGDVRKFLDPETGLPPTKNKGLSGQFVKIQQPTRTGTPKIFGGSPTPGSSSGLLNFAGNPIQANKVAQIIGVTAGKSIVSVLKGTPSLVNYAGNPISKKFPNLDILNPNFQPTLSAQYGLGKQANASHIALKYGPNPTYGPPSHLAPQHPFGLNFNPGKPINPNHLFVQPQGPYGPFPPDKYGPHGFNREGGDGYLKEVTGVADAPSLLKDGVVPRLFGNRKVGLSGLKTDTILEEARRSGGFKKGGNYRKINPEEKTAGRIFRGVYSQLKRTDDAQKLSYQELVDKAYQITQTQISDKGNAQFLLRTSDDNEKFSTVLGLDGALGSKAGNSRFSAYRNKSPILSFLSRAGQGIAGAGRKFSGNKYGAFANKVGNSNAALLASFAGVAGSSALFGSASTGINDKERKRGAIGDSIGGAFAGAGTGATLGTLGGPLGIALGAAAGGLIGFTSSLTQAKSQIEEARFGELLTELGEKIRVANKGLDKRDTSGTTDVSNFVGKIQYQIAKAERNSNFTTFDDLASDDSKEKARIKVLKNASGSIAELQPFIDKSIDYAIQNKSISADITPSGKNEVLRQFRGLFGGATGRTENLITSARKANGQSFDEDEELFQKIKVASLLNQIKESQNALEFTTNSFLDIANAARDAGESVQKFATDAETLSSIFSGGISGQKFQSFGALSRPGSIDTDQYNSQARRVGGLFGAPGRELSEKVISLNQLERDLPGILEKVKNDITAGGAGADGEGILNRALGGGIGGDFGNYVQDRITAAFPEGKVQRLLEQSSHEAAEQIFSVFRPLQEILPDAAKEFETSFNDFSKGLVDAAGQLAQVGLERDKISPLQLDLTRERARQNRTRLSVGDLQSPFNSAQGRLGGANAFSPVALGKELLETQRKLSALGDDPTKQNAQEFVRLSSRAADLQNALKRLTDATARNAGLQEKLAELEADRADRLALAKGFFGANGAGQANTARGLLLARGAVANPDSAQYLSAKQRQEVVGSLESVGNVNNVFGTGQTGNQLLEQLINQTVGFANLPKNEEGERQAVQAQILENLNQAVVAQQTLVNVLGSINSTFEQKVVAGFDAFLTKLDALISKINTNPVEAVGRSSGGVLFKPNGTDKVPAMLTAGEFVMRKSAVDRIGLSRLRELNAGGYAKGGQVGNGKPKVWEQAALNDLGAPGRALANMMENTNPRLRGAPGRSYGAASGPREYDNLHLKSIQEMQKKHYLNQKYPYVAGGFARGGIVRPQGRLRDVLGDKIDAKPSSPVIEEGRVYDDLYNKSVEQMVAGRRVKGGEEAVAAAGLDTDAALRLRDLNIRNQIFGGAAEFTQEPQSPFSIPTADSLGGIYKRRLTRASVANIRDTFAAQGLKGSALNRAVAAKKREHNKGVREDVKVQRLARIESLKEQRQIDKLYGETPVAREPVEYTGRAGYALSQRKIARNQLPDDEAALARKARAARIRSGGGISIDRETRLNQGRERLEAFRARRGPIYRTTRDKSTLTGAGGNFNSLTSTRSDSFARSGRNYGAERLQKNELDPIIRKSKEKKELVDSIPRYQYFPNNYSRQRSRRQDEENLDYQRIIRKARGFASGGIIDNIPAMLTKGEFVLNKNATNSVGVDKLKKVNRFAQGGLVGGQNTQGSSVGSGGPNFEAMTKASEQINKSILQFIASSKPLVDALNSFPREVSMKGEHTLQVVINGGEAISKIMPELKSYVEGEIRNSLQKLIKDKFPEVGSNL